MNKVVSNFRNLYRGKGVDENFDGDIRCFENVSNLSVKALMRNAFPKNIVVDNDSLDNDDSSDEKIYANLPIHVKTLADKVRRFIVAVKKNDTLGNLNLFETTVAKRNQVDHSKREKLRREVSIRWLSEYDQIDSLLYFLKQVIEVVVIS